MRDWRLIKVVDLPSVNQGTLRRDHLFCADAVIYVADSTLHPSRFGEAAVDLNEVFAMSHPSTPVAVLVRKQDCIECATVPEVLEKLQLQPAERWCAFPAGVHEQSGLAEAIDWLFERLEIGEADMDARRNKIIPIV